MTVQQFAPDQIQTRPAQETNAQLWQGLDSAVANNAGTFERLARPLEQGANSGGTSGINIDYDSQGQVAAITLSNQNLYAGDSGVSSRLASGKIFRGGDDEALSAMVFNPSELEGSTKH
jgi:hypothetical protein